MLSDLETFLTKLQVALGIDYTSEQLDLMSDFTTSKISFSSPGTGKTRTAIGGLLTAELFHKVPGNKIYALSFTNAATGEIKNRHEDACKKLRIKQTVNFSTLHSICTSILKANFEKLDMMHYSTSKDADMAILTDMLISSAKEWEMNLTPWQARMVVKATRALNSALTFDPAHVQAKKEFIDCKMSYEDFTRYRKLLYDYSKLSETIQVSDILLYTLEILLRFPEVGKKFKEGCKVMLVDEFQDLSLLQLRIISLLSDTVIAIGDIKQQIYAFNGACQEIVAQYHKYYPTATNINLTKSFRCKDEIAAYATKLILPNKVGGQDFEGTGPGGSVTFSTNADYDTLALNVADELAQNHNNFRKSKLFLFRNNFSVVPLVEALYRHQVPMQVHKYPAANTLPVVSDLCNTILFAQNSRVIENAFILNKLIPEFQMFKANEYNPLMKIATKTGDDILRINYNFKDPRAGNEVMSMILQVQDMLHTNATVRELFMIIWPVYEKFWLNDHAYQLEMEPEYYTRLVSSLIVNKNFNQFIKDEVKKNEVIEDCNSRRFGVRCYTFHAAKGLEADEVYIVDADDGIVPNKGQIVKLLKAGCVIDAAREIRNERSLVYVACTRAKEKLTIYHKEGQLSSLFTENNIYSELDTAYECYVDNYADVETFQEFFKNVP